MLLSIFFFRCRCRLSCVVVRSIAGFCRGVGPQRTIANDAHSQQIQFSQQSAICGSLSFSFYIFSRSLSLSLSPSIVKFPYHRSQLLPMQHNGRASSIGARIWPISIANESKRNETNDSHLISQFVVPYAAVHSRRRRRRHRIHCGCHSALRWSCISAIIAALHSNCRVHQCGTGLQSDMCVVCILHVVLYTLVERALARVHANYNVRNIQIGL